ncbi:MAG: hypothetical protein CBD74_09350 [Saprospirales bacterium TMED214]|nr:MAG: hypothetical protein CBD74_09350 [Saprospirales bacterium TMED214]
MSLLDAVTCEQATRAGVWCKQTWLWSCVDYWCADVWDRVAAGGSVIELLDLEVRAPGFEQELAFVMAEHEEIAEVPAELYAGELPLAE